MACTTETLSRKLSDAESELLAESRKRLTSVLVVDDEPGILSFLHKGLTTQFGLVETAADTDAADALLARCHFDLIISDIRLPDRSGVEWIAALREQNQTTPVIFMTAHADLHTAIKALRAGALPGGHGIGDRAGADVALRDAEGDKGGGEDEGGGSLRVQRRVGRHVIPCPAAVDGETGGFAAVDNEADPPGYLGVGVDLEVGFGGVVADGGSHAGDVDGDGGHDGYLGASAA